MPAKKKEERKGLRFEIVQKVLDSDEDDLLGFIEKKLINRIKKKKPDETILMRVSLSSIR
jgi:hypothetical protein